MSKIEFSGTIKLEDSDEKVTTSNETYLTEGKSMNEYKLTFTVTIQEQDDPAARQQAKELLQAVGKVVSDAEAKLQQVYQDQPPRGVRIT